MASNLSLRDWKTAIVIEQEQYQAMLGNRKFDTFRDGEDNLLMRKLAFAIFGPPKTTEIGYELLGYETSSINKVKSILDVLKKNSPGDINISFIFIACFTEDNTFFVPVFRINCCGKVKCTCQKKAIYVDAVPRTYTHWDDYLDHNQLPECTMACPSEGLYWIPSDDDKGFNVAFRDAPACCLGNQMRRWIDVGATILGVLSGCVSLLAMFMVPIAAPIMIGAICGGAIASTLVVARRVDTLYDMSQHGESIGIGSAQARQCYAHIGLGIAGVATAFGALKLSSMAKAGQSLALETIKKPMNAGKIIALSSSGANLINDLASLTQKKLAGEDADLEIASLMASSFFFCSVVYSCTQVKSMLKDMLEAGDSEAKSIIAQNNVLKNGASFVGINSALTTAFCMQVCNTKVDFRHFCDFLWDKCICNSPKEMQSVWNEWVTVTAKVAQKYLGTFAGTLTTSTLVVEDAMLLRSKMESVKAWIDKCFPAEKYGVAHIDGFLDDFLKIHSEVKKHNECKNIRDSVAQMLFIKKYVQNAYAEKIATYEAGFALVQKLCPSATREMYNAEQGIKENYQSHFMAQTMKEFKNGKGYHQLCNAVEILATESLSIGDFVFVHGANTLQFDGLNLEDRPLKKNHGKNIIGIDEDNVRFVIDYSKGTATITFSDPNIGIREIRIEADENEADGKVAGKITVKTRDTEHQYNQRV